MIVAALAFVGAVALGWKTAPTPPETGTQQTSPETKVSRERVPGGRDAAAAEVARKMRAVRAGITQEQRIRSAVSLAMALPPSEFAEWAEGDRFDFRAGPELSIFRMVLFERWQMEEPDSLIEFAVRNNHGQAYRGLEQLLKNDPTRVLEYFRAHPNDSFELGKLPALAASEPGLVMTRLAEMSERGMTAKAGEASEKLFRELAAKHPSMLEAALDDLSPVLQKKAETALSGVRLAADFQSEIRALWERPDGWEIFSESLQANPALGAGFLGELAAMPVSWKNSLGDFPYYAVRGESARKWLEMDLEEAGFSERHVDSIRVRAAQELMRKDPDFVIGVLGSLNLEKRERAELFAAAFMRLRNSPEKAERLIAELGSEEDRTAAREQLELQKLRSESPEVKEPGDWIQAFGSGVATSSSVYAFTAETGRWDEKQVSAFQEEFKDLASTEKQKVALALASRAADAGGNEALVSDAIGYLVNHPPETDERGWMRDDPRMMASEFALRIASRDLTAASAWINTLPEGEASQWARRNVAKDLQQYDPAAVRDWIKTLPQGQRNDLNGYLAGEE